MYLCNLLLFWMIDYCFLYFQAAKAKKKAAESSGDGDKKSKYVCVMSMCSFFFICNIANVKRK